MNKDLQKRLDSLGITYENLLEVINATDREAVFIYTSHMEGLGTWSSDFDVYVLCEEYPEIDYGRILKDHRIRMPEIDKKSLGITGMAYLCIDIEYWTISTVIELLEKVKQNKYIDKENIKMLLRIKHGEKVYSPKFKDIVNKICNSDFIRYSIPQFSTISDAELHDCISLYEAGDYFGAILCGRNALNQAIAGLNAKNGNINFNVEKWSSRIFLTNEGYGNKDYLEKYKVLQFYSSIEEDTIKDFCYNIIIFIQDILNYELGFLGKKHWLNKENYEMLDEENDPMYVFNNSVNKGIGNV